MLDVLVHEVRNILNQDDDGIVPLVDSTGEEPLGSRVESAFISIGVTTAQISEFEKMLGSSISDFLLNDFFEKLSDRLNIYTYQARTPFIWHLTSGPEQGFDCYIIIYKWNRDNLLRLRSVYIENRERALVNRQTDLQGKPQLTAKEQSELDTILKQLKEIESFKVKIDELLAEGYNPVLDDGVGKNIAPLQKKKMLAYDVLNAGQLTKYLNADW